MLNDMRFNLVESLKKAAWTNWHDLLLHLTAELRVCTNSSFAHNFFFGTEKNKKKNRPIPLYQLLLSQPLCPLWVCNAVECTLICIRHYIGAQRTCAVDKRNSTRLITVWSVVCFAVVGATGAQSIWRAFAGKRIKFHELSVWRASFPYDQIIGNALVLCWVNSRLTSGVVTHHSYMLSRTSTEGKGRCTGTLHNSERKQDAVASFVIIRQWLCAPSACMRCTGDRCTEPIAELQN